MNIEREQPERTGRHWILFASLLTLFLGGIITWLSIRITGASELETKRKGELLVMGVLLLILGLICMGFWIWARREPYLAALTALIIYSFIIVSHAILNPEVITRGLLFKLLIVAALCKALATASAFRNQHLKDSANDSS